MNSRQENRSELSVYSQNQNLIFFATLSLNSRSKKMSKSFLKMILLWIRSLLVYKLKPHKPYVRLQETEKKKHIKDKNCSGLPVGMLLLKVIKCSRIAWDLSTLLRLKQVQVSRLIFENDAIRNRISNDFDKRWICQQKANYRTILIAAVFHFVHQVEKDSLKHHKMTQNSVSFGYQ